MASGETPFHNDPSSGKYNDEEKELLSNMKEKSMESVIGKMKNREIGSNNDAKSIKENLEDRLDLVKEMISVLERRNDQDDDEEALVMIGRIEEIKIDNEARIRRSADNSKAKWRGDIEKLKRILKFYNDDVHSANEDVILEVEEELRNIQKSFSSKTVESRNQVLQSKKSMLPSNFHGRSDKKVSDNTTLPKMPKVTVTEKSQFTHVDNTEPILNIIPFNHDDALVRRWDSYKLEVVDSSGSVKRVRKHPREIEYAADCLLMGDHIIYTLFSDMMIRCISSDGTMFNILRTSPLLPNGICVSRDDGILVALCSCYTTKITSASRGEIQHINIKNWTIRKYGHTTDQPDSKLVHPYRIAQNINMDICVVDIVDTEYNSILVVLSEESHVRFIYTGHQSLKETFSPNGVACDQCGRIILTDSNGLHLLSEDGQFLGLILTNHDLPQRPVCLGIFENTMWVGCSRGMIKVYDYTDD